MRRKSRLDLARVTKKCLCLVLGVPASKIGEAPIHDVKAASFGYQNVEHIDLVHLAIADMNEGWNIAAQVKQRMHLNGSLGGAEACPGKDAQAQVDGRGIECVDRLFQLDSKAVAGVKLSCNLDQAHREIHIDAAVALLVGIGQRTLGDVASYAQMVELGLMSAQTGFDVAQTLAVSQLCESHAQKLIEMRKSLGGIF